MTLICPSCKQPAHRPWEGKVINPLFIDFDNGNYSNSVEYELVCPVTNEKVRGVKATVGGQYIKESVTLKLYATGEGA